MVISTTRRSHRHHASGQHTLASSRRHGAPCVAVGDLHPEPARACDQLERRSGADLGWTAAEVIDQPLPTIPAASRSEYHTLWQRIMDDEWCSGIETQRQRKDGTLIDLCLAIASLCDEHTQHIGALVIAEDIGKRKQAERALQHNQQRYQQLLLAAQRQTQELALLEQVRTAVARELDLLDVIRAAVDGIAATFGYQQVSIYLLQHDTLVLQYQIGYPQVIARLPVTQGVMGFVARTGEPVLIEDVGTDARFLAAFPGITSEVCVPICDETQTVGVLNVESVGDVRLGHADLCFMRAQPTH